MLPLSRLGTPPLPPAIGVGYVHSLPFASQSLQVVLTPLLTHLTLDRLHREHAMDERILGWSARRGPASKTLPSLEVAASNFRAAV
jgi:hypothetical protein